MPFWNLWCPSWKSKFGADIPPLQIFTVHQRILVYEWLLVVFFSRKVNSFLNKMNPTEVQMAAYVDTLRDKQWPEFKPAAPPPPPRTDEEKNETRDRAHNLINARCRWRLSSLVGNAQLFCFNPSKYHFYLLCRFKLSCTEEDRHGVCF